MVKLIILYNLFVVAIIEWLSLKSIDSITGLVLPLLLVPLMVHLTLELKRRPRKLGPKTELVTFQKSISGEVIQGPAGISDRDRRLFLKLIGSTGLSLFFMSLVSKEAQATFFGSMPGPGTLALKDSTGTTIDPAKNHPTDGYKISQLDDSGGTYLYFAYVNKDGAWYIQRETINGVNTGDYRYYKGSSDFAANWSNRSGLAYDDFDDIF